MRLHFLLKSPHFCRNWQGRQKLAGSADGSVRSKISNFWQNNFGRTFGRTVLPKKHRNNFRSYTRLRYCRGDMPAYCSNTPENASYSHADTFSTDPFVLLARLLANLLLFTLGKRIIILPILLRHPVRMGLRSSIVTRGNATQWLLWPQISRLNQYIINQTFIRSTILWANSLCHSPPKNSWRSALLLHSAMRAG